MPASLATALTLMLILGLFVWDARHNEEQSSALWVPTIWVLIVASRFPSQWLQLYDPVISGNVEDGSPVDAVFFGFLVVLGYLVLRRRHAFQRELWVQNSWLVALILYGLLSIAWSEFPFVAFKRWVKALGHPLMAMIVLTDRYPVDSLRVLMKRAAIILLPLSVLFVKYLPEYGRAFDPWSGEGVYRGVALTKNDLGYVCMVFGLFFLWNFLASGKSPNANGRRHERFFSFLVLVTVAYLLLLADSATSIATLVIGAATLVGLGTGLVSRKYLGIYVFVFGVVVFSSQVTLDLYSKVLGILGRDPTLTDRSEIWADVIALQTRPLFGMGFESFWLGSRLDWMSEKWWWQPNQAHNGYIEIYLNLGFLGLSLFLGLVVTAFRRISTELKSDFDFEFARLRLSLLLAILAHNYTEATFKGVHLLWTIFNIVVVRVSEPGLAEMTHSSRRSSEHGQKVELSDRRSDDAR